MVWGCAKLTRRKLLDHTAYDGVNSYTELFSVKQTPYHFGKRSGGSLKSYPDYQLAQQLGIYTELKTEASIAYTCNPSTGELDVGGVPRTAGSLATKGDPVPNQGPPKWLRRQRRPP